MARVLVIDDDDDFVLSVRLTLEAHGFEVEAAHSAEEGIHRVLDRRPDLVILDVMMPSGHEGFDAARAIRQHGLRDLPIIILTSLHAKRDLPHRFVPDGTYLPVDVFLDKPVAPQELIATINELLGERREEPAQPL